MMTSSPKTLSVLFVLVAACSNAESSPRSSRVRETGSAVSLPVPANGPAGAPVGAPPAIELPAVTVAVPAPTAGPARTSSPSELSVVAATFTHGVESRRPVDHVTTFAVGDRATVHLVVKNLGAPRDVTVEWMRGDVAIGRMTLEVGTSPSWRTWATRRVTARDVASGIRARIVDDEGNVLETIEAPVAAAANSSTPSA